MSYGKELLTHPERVHSLPSQQSTFDFSSPTVIYETKINVTLSRLLSVSNIDIHIFISFHSTFSFVDVKKEKRLRGQLFNQMSFEIKSSFIIWLQ